MELNAELLDESLDRGLVSHNLNFNCSILAYCKAAPFIEIIKYCLTNSIRFP